MKTLLTVAALGFAACPTSEADPPATPDGPLAVADGRLATGRPDALFPILVDAAPQTFIDAPSAPANPYAVTLTPGEAGTLSGIIEAPPGFTTEGAIVVACVRAGPSCAATGTVTAPVVANGRDGTFELAGLDDLEYAVIAFLDVDGSGSLNGGDLVGAWIGADGSIVWTRPAFVGTRMTLDRVPADPPAEASPDAGAVAPPTATPVPLELVGTWLTAGASSSYGFELRADGTYTYSGYFALLLDGGCTRNGVYIAPYVFVFRRGVIQVNANELALVETESIYQRDADCVYQRDVVTELETHAGTWRVTPDSEGRANLYTTVLSVSGVEELFRPNSALPSPP